MSRHRRTALVITPAILALLSLSLSAQRPVTRSIFVEALDTAGSPVVNLTAADFELTENGTKREITRATLGSAPMRIVLMVDSSTPVGPMINQMKTALNAFADSLPETEEVAFVSSGGQIRVRTQPSADRDKLRAEIGRFAAEGGANAFLETMIEADNRFLKPVPAQWPALVIVTTDNGETTREPNVDRYNRFMNDFLARGGTAHAVILQGKRTGPVTDIVANLVENTGGIRTTLIADSSLPTRLKDIANRLADDHQIMMRRYEIAYAGDAKAVQPIVNVTLTGRDDVRLKMSARRPF